MSFTAQVVFTGLGMVVIRTGERRSATPTGVELLLLDSLDHHHSSRMDRDHSSRMDHHHSPSVDPHHLHVPKVSFRLADVRDPINDDVEDIRVDADGSYLVEERIKGADFSIAVEGEPAPFEAVWAEKETATRPATGAPEDALDWIPDIVEHFGVDRVKLPRERLESPYAARVRLPEGRLSTQQLFRTDNQEPELWEFRPDGRRHIRVLAEQWVWTRSGLTSLTIPLPERTYAVDAHKEARPARTYVLDGADLILQGKEPVVKIAVTNLPKVARIGRGRVPEHFHFLAAVSGTRTSLENFDVQRTRAGGVTTGGSCPPILTQVLP